MSFSPSSQMKAAPSVRFSLAALVLGCVLPMAAVAVFLVLQFYENERAQIIAASVSRARAVMAQVDRNFDTTQAALRALATSRMLASGDLAGFHGRAQDVLHNLNADSILLLAPDGRILLSTRRPYGSALPQLTEMPLLKRTIATGQPGVSDLFVGPLAGGLLYTVAVPASRRGRLPAPVRSAPAPRARCRRRCARRCPAPAPARPRWRRPARPACGAGRRSVRRAGCLSPPSSGCWANGCRR